MLITILLNVLFSFGASSLFALLFNAPKHTLFSSGVVGASGWMTFQFCLYLNYPPAFSSFLGGIVIGVFGHYMSKKLLTPLILFIVPGIIPLVPGGAAYESIKYIILYEYNEALFSIIKVAVLSGAIALGLTSSDVVMKVYYYCKNKVKAF